MTTETNLKQFTSKLSDHRHGPKSRIWIEGKRLLNAGFRPGITVFAVWTPATLTLHTACTNPDFDEQRTVSGKGERPIIDITGERVHETFGKHGAHVSVTYGDGVITIRRAK